MPNGELFEYIVRRKKISEEEAKVIYKQIIDRIEYLHRLNTIHRDLKPENVLLELDSDIIKKIKLIDFEFSNTILATQHRTEYCGTLDYVATEVLLNQA